MIKLVEKFFLATFIRTWFFDQKTKVTYMDVAEPKRHRQFVVETFVRLVALTILFTALYFVVMKQSQSFSFADESEHLTPAWMMIQGKVLYQDLSTNHQPLPIVLAVAFWKLIPVANFFMLIERVRQFMFALSFLGALAVTLRFKWRGLGTVLLVELTKFYFLGFHLLAESIVVYPIIFLTGQTFMAIFTERNKGVWQKVFDIIFGACLFIVTFSLVPSWPFLAAITIGYLLARRSIVSTVFVSGTFVFLSLLLFVFVPLPLWVNETITNNTKYFIPYQPGLDPLSLMRIAIFPFLSFFEFGGVVPKIYFSLTLVSISLILVGLRITKRPLKIITPAVISYSLLVILNPRVTTVRVGFYSAFHLLPQIVFFITMVVFFAGHLVGKLPNRWMRIKFVIGTVILFGLVASTSTAWVYESTTVDKVGQHFVSYGDEESIGLAISAISEPSDTLLAGPQSFLNLATTLPLATGQTAFLEWAYRSPTLRERFFQDISTKPPTFIFFPDSDNPYLQSLRPTLSKNYQRIKRSFGKKTDLYVLNSKLNRVRSDQWERFSFLLYAKP